MSRTRFAGSSLLGLIFVAALIGIWKLSRGGEPEEVAGANRPAVLVGADDRESVGLDALDGDPSEPVARVEAGADEAVPVDEEPAPVPTPSGARIWLVGRVLDPAGDPVAARELSARFQVHRGMFGPTHFGTRVTTDADGRFRQDVDDAWLEEGTPMTFEVVDAVVPVDDSGDRELTHTRDPTPLAARAAFVVPSHLDAGEHDLGEADIRGPVILAGGRTVDGRGDAVAGVDVSVRWAQSVTVLPGADPEQFMREMWWRLDGVGVRSSEAGTFELVGFVPEAPLRIEAKKDGYLDADPVECEIGTTGVDVVLLAGGGLAGRILFDDGIPLDRFQIEVRVGEGMEGFRRLSLDRDGGFEAEGLPPGQGLVSLVLKPDRDTLLEIDEVDVGSGTTHRDPRLDPLDLRGGMTVAAVTVRDAAGEVLDTAEGRVVGMHFPDTSSRSFAPRETPGVLSFLGLGDGIDVEVWATGYRAQVLTGVRGALDVQLEAGTPIRAGLSTPPLEEGESLSLMLEIEDEYWRQVAVAPIEPDGEAELIASHEGLHQFSLWLEISTPERSGRIRLQSPEAALEFDVVQGVIPSIQTIVLTEASLTAAREGWRLFR